MKRLRERTTKYFLKYVSSRLALHPREWQSNKIITILQGHFHIILYWFKISTKIPVNYRQSLNGFAIKQPFFQPNSFQQPLYMCYHIHMHQQSAVLLSSRTLFPNQILFLVKEWAYMVVLMIRLIWEHQLCGKNSSERQS